MPAWLLPAILGGASVAGNIIGGKKNADAAKKAAAEQGKASDRAFQYARENRDRMQGLNAPFLRGMDQHVGTFRSLTTPGMRYAPPPQQARPLPAPMPSQQPMPQTMPWLSGSPDQVQPMGEQQPGNAMVGAMQGMVRPLAGRGMTMGTLRGYQQ